MIRRIDQARPAVVYGLLALLLAAVFVPMSLFRLVDGDEGTYLLVSRLVVEGQLPYHDFFYPQMFLLPYVYGAWMKLVGYSWYGARLLSAAFSVMLGLLVYRQTALLAGARPWGVLAVVLLASSSLAFGWFPLVKTFVLPTLLLFAAYAVLSTHARWRWLASGFLLGLSVACRVYVLGVAPAFLIEMYRTERDRRSRLMQLACFAIGFVVALLPAEYLFLIDPETFVFNIAGNQLIRADYTSLSWWEQKTHAPMLLVGIRSAEGVTSLQFLFLYLVNLASWVSSAVSREQFPLASLIAILLIVASLVPTPVYTQYFCMPLPFLIVSGVAFLAVLRRESPGPRFRHVLAVVGAVYVLVAPWDIRRHTVTGDFIPGPTTVADWRIPTIRAVGRAIDRQIRPGRHVAISLWPGYFVETHAAILPGLENQHAFFFASKLSATESAHFKLLTARELLQHLWRHTADVVVLGHWGPESTRIARDQLVKSGYALTGRIVSVEIYTLRAHEDDEMTTRFQSMGAPNLATIMGPASQ